jgi:carboxyl-terminal processing protease
VFNKGLIQQFCFEYTDKNRPELEKYETASKIEKTLRTNNVLEQFIKYADKNGVKRRNLMIKKSQKLFEQVIYGTIIYNILEMEDYVEYINKDDQTILKAIELFNQKKTIPELSSKDKANLEENN